MKLKKFRIQNYKSIIDTSVCYINKDLTILAGMNESGKSSILEAIRDFSIEVDISRDAKRIKNDTGEPKITLFFMLSKEDVESIFDRLDIEESDNFELHDYLSSKEIALTKSFNNTYSLEDILLDHINSKFKENFKESYTTISKKVRALKNIEELEKVNFSEINSKATNVNMTKLISDIRFILKPYKITKGIDEEGKPLNKRVYEESKLEGEVHEKATRLVDEIEELLPYTYNYLKQEEFIKEFISAILAVLPTMIFFSDFDNALKYEIPINDLHKNKIHVDLCKLAGIDIDKLQELTKKDTETSRQERDNYLSDKSAIISNQFKTEWLQDEIDITFSADGKIIKFGIKEVDDTATYRAEQRSKGFQWFLSFYIRFYAESLNNNIILIDEPGLYLHAKAQDDVLKLLEKVSNNDEENTVIITTHSPYLVDVDNFNRLLLVEKNDKDGTLILKPHKGANENTLTPVITRMGFDIAKSTFFRDKNILTEGISDYYYLKFFLKLFKFENSFKSVSFIPAVGASKIPQLVSFCIGWGVGYLALFDMDKEGKDNAQIIEKSYGDLANTLFICDTTDCSIEDLFSIDDFNKIVLLNIETKNTDAGKKNSKFLKDNKIDKVLVAKLFCDNIAKASKKDFSKETISNFESLFNNICKKLCISIDDDAKTKSKK